MDFIYRHVESSNPLMIIPLAGEQQEDFPVAEWKSQTTG